MLLSTVLLSCFFSRIGIARQNSRVTVCSVPLTSIIRLSGPAKRRNFAAHPSICLVTPRSDICLRLAYQLGEAVHGNAPPIELRMLFCVQAGELAQRFRDTARPRERRLEEIKKPLRVCSISKSPNEAGTKATTVTKNKRVWPTSAKYSASLLHCNTRASEPA